MVVADIVLGCSFGDEGKGKVVYNLLKKDGYDLCVRFNGSGNAGHTVYDNGQKYVVHQLPVGILMPKVYNLISSDSLVDINRLKKEINEIRSKGIEIEGRLFMSKACHIITTDCINYDKANNKIGTTGSGIGPTYSQKMLRVGKRVEDYAEEIAALGIKIVDMRKFWFSDFVNENIKKVLLEGAQGFELDINWTNNYPYCTSSTCTLGGAINTGISIHNIRNIYGISKAYDTYVGTMQFQQEEYVEDLNKIAEHGKEYGTTTERKRQCNYLNIDNLIESLKINSCTTCIINKVDILEDLNIFKLYSDGVLKEFENMDEMKAFLRNKLSFLKEIVFSSNPVSI
jgi:adenylosuccinate synthase